MRNWLKGFLTSGRAGLLAWGGLLAGLLVLAQCAYSEHDRRLAAELGAPVALPLIRDLNAERAATQRTLDSLRTLLTQCQARESMTLLNYQTYQANEAKRIADARGRAAAESGASQQGKLANRYPAPRK